MKKTVGTSCVKIAVSGEAGSFSEQAGFLYAQQKNFEPEILYAKGMMDVLNRVEKCTSQLGLFPVHNSQSGFVKEALQAMNRHDYPTESFEDFFVSQPKEASQLLQNLQRNTRVVDLFQMEISQCLMVLPGVKREEITQIASYVQALWQCDQYLLKNFLQTKLVEWSDTAQAAEDLVQGRLPRTTAVVASARAAQLYGLEILEQGIENKKDGLPNITTFLVVQKVAKEKTQSTLARVQPLSARSHEPTFGIIGGGRFGKFWAECLENYGQVLVYDQKKIRFQKGSAIRNVSLKEVIQADMLFLCMPMSKIETCCQKIAPLLSPKTVVIDVCSVKMHPVKIMKKYLPRQQHLIASHPLFGPHSVKRLGLAGRRIMVDPLRCTTTEQKMFEQILKKMELEILHVTPREHDLQMANSQALVHFLGRALKALNLKEQKISTPDYQSLVAINELVNNDSWDLFYNMQRLNPFTKKMRQKLLRALVRLEKKIEHDHSNLEGLRKNINDLDREIIEAIAQRFALTKKIGLLKKKTHTPITDKKREQKLQQFHRRLSKKQRLSPRVVDQVFQLLMGESKRLQR